MQVFDELLKARLVRPVAAPEQLVSLIAVDDFVAQSAGDACARWSHLLLYNFFVALDLMLGVRRSILIVLVLFGKMLVESRLHRPLVKGQLLLGLLGLGGS